MSISPNLLRVFYKGTEQRIKIFEGTPNSDILNIIKQAFHIDECISKIFLQDEDGDLICLPPKIPNGLCVYVYLEPSIMPTAQKETSSKNKNSLLPGFKWDGTFSNLDGKPHILNDGYTLGNHKCDGWTPVVSTETYTHGKLFTKMTIELSVYQTIGIYTPGDPAHIEYGLDESVPYIATREFIGPANNNKLISIALLLDVDNHYVEFFWIDNDKVMKREKRVIPKGPAKIYAWTKGSPITIQENGSSPIPDYI